MRSSAKRSRAQLLHHHHLFHPPTVRTQDLMKEYSTGPLLETRQAIASTLPATPMTAQTAAAAHTDLVHFLVWESRDAKGLSGEIDTVLEFYERLVICVENRLCNQAVARAYFAGDAAGLFDNFAPYIEERRKNSPKFGTISDRLRQR